MRVIDCECGSTIKAASDEELTSELREHMEEEHPDDARSDEELDELVRERAYDADDS